MDLNIITTKEIKEVVEFVSFKINDNLAQGKKVLWFVSGGSAIIPEVEIAKRIKEEYSDKLVVILGDERYGEVDYPESNWFKLNNSRFKIKGAKMVPIIIGKGMRETTENIRDILQDEFASSQYKIGFFGIGVDGHTAGILPHTEAVNSKELICTYETDLHTRITITPKTIMMLDEAVLFSLGEMKWGALNKLKEEVPIDEEPAQVLKNVPLLTIFTDYKTNNI